MNRLHTSMALLFFMGAAAVPAVAGTVFVPLASNLSNGGAGYATKVWVSNPDSATHHFTTTFIQEGTDGTASSTTSGNIFVQASGTSILTGVAPPGVTGLLEIDGPAPLVVSARMEVTDSNGNLIGIAAVPALTQDSAVAAGSFVEVQGLQEGPGLYTTDFSMVNLGGNTAQCTVGIFNAAGTLVAPVATLTVMPLSRRDFGGVLQTLGVPAITDVRVVATCNQTFYAFATVFQPGGAAISVIGPSPTLAGTVGPGSTTTGGSPAAGTVTFSVPGTFLNATQADSEQLYDIPAPTGVPFKLATIAWDMRIGVFPSGLFTGVMAFRRPNNQRALREPFCAVQIVNRNSKTLLDLGVENVFERTVGPWKQDNTYHCQLTYDLTGNTCQLDVSQTAGGPIIYTIAGPAQWFDLSANSNPLEVDFGQTGIGDGAYYPPVSWSFSNLNVVLVPK